VKIGLRLPQAGEGHATKESIVSVAKGAENAGFDSFKRYQVSCIPFENRGKRQDEYLQILKKIWTDDVVEFKGQFYNIPASKVGPKPVQRPHIPIYLGGYSQSIFVRIANYANGWICVIRHSLDEAESSINKTRNECRKAKRDPKDIHIAAILYPNIIDSDNTDEERHGKQPKRQLLSGSVDQVGKDLQEVERIGVDHIILNFNRSVISDNTDKIIKVSKELSSFIK